LKTHIKHVSHIEIAINNLINFRILSSVFKQPRRRVSKITRPFLLLLQRPRGRYEVHQKVHDSLHEGGAERAFQLALRRHQRGHHGALPRRPVPGR